MMSRLVGWELQITTYWLCSQQNQIESKSSENGLSFCHDNHSLPVKPTGPEWE